jgi:hypothetical protein
MKFGVRECANIVFRAKQKTKIGTNTFNVGQPVLYIDTATASSMEQASTTVYAQGGRGNARLIAWEGDKTLTFTLTDALISPISLAMLSGAGLVKEAGSSVHVHATTRATMKVSGTTGTIDLTDALRTFGPVTGADKITVDAGIDAPVFIIKTEDDGSITGEIVTGADGTGNAKGVSFAYDESGRGILTINGPKLSNGITSTAINEDMNVMVDYYVIKKAEKVSEIQITAADFAGYYYVEADTLFRAQATGVDMPANLTFPNVKVQSGFTISMSGTGDPSTFDFTMDAFPGYTYFDKSKEVLCVIQVVEDSEAAASEGHSVMLNNNHREHEDPLKGDSYSGVPVEN